MSRRIKGELAENWSNWSKAPEASWRWPEQGAARAQRSELSGHETVLIECGAGTAVPGIRRFGEELLDQLDRATLVRINPEPTPSPRPNVINLTAPAATALQAVAEGLR